MSTPNTEYALTEDKIEKGVGAVVDEVLDSLRLAIKAGTTREELLATVEDACTNHFDDLVERFIAFAAPIDSSGSPDA